VALFVKEENILHAEHFDNEHSVPKLSYLSDTFERVQCIRRKYARQRYLYHRSDRQDEGIYEVRKLERKSLDMLPRLKDFVEEISMETSDTEIGQCIKGH
jgi:hypothetical protein